MRSVVICGPELPSSAGRDAVRAVSIDGVRVPCGVIVTADRAFDRDAPANAEKVLVRVRRFSCNYRDKGFVLRAAARLPADRCFAIGSEFVGDVVAVGTGVERVRPGDRVMGDNSYPHGARGGVPTNGASREYLVLHEDKVIAVPAGMPDDVAAAFSLGAQTAFSMVARLAPQRGDRVLVTAARSNTSLFAMAALHARGVEVHLVTSSAGHVDQLRARGASEVYVVDPAQSHTGQQALVAAARRAGGFTGAIDPFFDLHLHHVLPLMRNGARYVTCGFQAQRGVDPDAAAANASAHAAICMAIVNNVSIIGNCLGLRTHLEQALAAYDTGKLEVAIDSVFAGDAAGFLARTFTAADRFGKVVYAYH